MSSLRCWFATSGQARTPGFWSCPFFYKTPHFHQDRLGTNAGKAPKRDPFVITTCCLQKSRALQCVPWWSSRCGGSSSSSSTDNSSIFPSRWNITIGIEPGGYRSQCSYPSTADELTWATYHHRVLALSRQRRFLKGARAKSQPRTKYSMS